MKTVALLFVVIVLTTPEGQKIWIESKHMQSMRAPDHHCAPRSRALIRFDNGGSLCVMETPAEVGDAISSGGVKP